MSELIENQTQSTEKNSVPQSPEVADEVIKRLIHDTVWQKPAKLSFPKNDEHRN